MARPRKTSPVVRTYLRSSRGKVQVRIYARQNNLDKTAVGQDLEQALARLDLGLGSQSKKRSK